MSTGRYRCAACAATFTAYAPAECHADAEHHHRIEVHLNKTVGGRTTTGAERRLSSTGAGPGTRTAQHNNPGAPTPENGEPA